MASGREFISGSIVHSTSPTVKTASGNESGTYDELAAYLRRRPR